MKYLILLLLLSGCTEGAKEVSVNSDLLRFKDKQNNVLCYRVRGWQGFSCVRVK